MAYLCINIYHWSLSLITQLLENIAFCNNPAELTDLETYLMWTL